MDLDWALKLEVEHQRWLKSVVMAEPDFAQMAAEADLQHLLWLESVPVAGDS